MKGKINCTENKPFCGKSSKMKEKFSTEFARYECVSTLELLWGKSADFPFLRLEIGEECCRKGQMLSRSRERKFFTEK